MLSAPRVHSLNLTHITTAPPTSGRPAGLGTGQGSPNYLCWSFLWPRERGVQMTALVPSRSYPGRFSAS